MLGMRWPRGKRQQIQGAAYRVTFTRELSSFARLSARVLLKELNPCTRGTNDTFVRSNKRRSSDEYRKMEMVILKNLFFVLKISSLS